MRVSHVRHPMLPGKEGPVAKGHQQDNSGKNGCQLIGIRLIGILSRAHVQRESFFFFNERLSSFICTPHAVIHKSQVRGHCDAKKEGGKGQQLLTMEIFR